MTKPLPDRLRAYADTLAEHGHAYLAQVTALDAADLIVRQAAEIARLQAAEDSRAENLATLAELVVKQGAEIQRLEHAEELARDALRNAGYVDQANAGVPLPVLIETMRVDARALIQAHAQEAAKLRKELGR